jgi:glycosyltransferase involved in cell wall biosynthesis
MVVSPHGEASEIVEREQCGLWVPAGNPELFAWKILFLKETPEQLMNFSIKSLDASKRYTRETQAKKMIDVIENVVSGR